MGTVKTVRNRKDYRQLPKNHRASVPASIGTFLLEHRGTVFNADELIEEMQKLGFKVDRVKQIVAACDRYNGAHFRRSRMGRHLDAEIKMDWLEGEGDEPNVRVFYIE